MGTYSGRRPSGTDSRYRYVGLKAFEQYKDTQKRRRQEYNHLIRRMQRRIVALEDQIVDLLSAPAGSTSSEDEEE